MLTRIAATGPEFIYYPIFIAAGGHITSQARETAGLENTYLMGADGMFSPDFWEAAGDAAIGMYHSSPDLSAVWRRLPELSGAARGQVRRKADCPVPRPRLRRGDDHL